MADLFVALLGLRCGVHESYASLARRRDASISAILSVLRILGH